MVVIQNTVVGIAVDEKSLTNTLQQMLDDLHQGENELLIRLVDKSEIQALNKTYRQQNKPTNVLSFSSDLPTEVAEPILGDVVICLAVVLAEAKRQTKSFECHLIHIALHGTLHLLGYDHLKSKDAEEMEELEVKILQKIGIRNPYS